ncbi:hypothetical protein SDC9_83031 [bioreactor metagenome]|uniref:Secretion system C-terminal sorting domain-containing protein n=1 Tax=bioreactor metagenome TaxID=1076179 RepID=A0A644Z6B6_9ZZZZ
MTGRIILRQTRELQSGKNNIILTTEKLSNGMYLLIAGQNENTTCIKLVK